MKFHWEMSEPAFFWTRCLKILTVNLMLKHWKCVKSFQTLTSSRQHINVNLFPHTTTTTARPPTATVERPGQCPYVGQPRAAWSTSAIPSTTPPHHLSAATPTLPASSTTIKTTTTTQEGWRSVRRMGRRGTGGQKDDDNAVCNPHAVLSIPFLFYFPSFCLMMQCATHTPCRQFLFYFIFFLFCLMRCATHTLCCQFLFYFIFLLFCLMMWCATHMPCRQFLFYFIFLPFVWRCGVQPTCCVVNFFPFFC